MFLLHYLSFYWGFKKNTFSVFLSVGKLQNSNTKMCQDYNVIRINFPGYCGGAKSCRDNEIVISHNPTVH